MIRNRFCLVSTAIALLFTAAEAADPKPDQAADEKAIRATADNFVKAFNAADAKALGALWTLDAEYTDVAGNVFRGRAAIEKEYAALFKALPGATTTISVESIRFLGPETAVEKGIAKVKAAKEERGSRYTVVHIKRDNQWSMAVGHDAPYVPQSNGDYLKEVAWLVGEWKPDNKDAATQVRFEWMPGKNFLKGSFAGTKEKNAAGEQWIGWNPKLGSLVAWHFSEEGAFGTEVWTKDGNKWVITAGGVAQDGSESAAVNIVTPIDAETFTWQSVKRTLDGVRLPDTGVVKFVKLKSAK